MKNSRTSKILRVLWLTFCEVDQRFLDLFRVGYALVLLTGIGLSIYSVANGNEFDVTAFGTGLGAILFGGGVGAGLRGKFEDGTGGSPEAEQIGPDWQRNSPWSDHPDLPPDVNDGINTQSPWLEPSEGDK